jgi:hypothetical protein
MQHNQRVIDDGMFVNILTRPTQNLSGKPVGSDDEIFREHTILTWKLLYINKKLLPLGSIVNDQKTL